MYVGTLHSLCQKLLSDRRFSEGMARSRRPVIMDELDQHFFIARSDNWNALLEAGGFDPSKAVDAYYQINTWFGMSREKGSKTNTVKNCISFFNRMSEEDFADKDIKLENADETEKALFKMTIKYRELLKGEHADKVDFSCLQQRAYQYISQQLLSGTVFQHVIVDEYQDTNTIQKKIYMQLASGNKNICVVGDDDQALYRFRGATVENLVDFENICEKEIGVKPTRIDLNINYRSRKQIVDTYTSFIEGTNWENPDKPGQYYRIPDKNIVAHSEDNNTSVILESGKKEDVTKNIVELIRKIKEEGKISDYNQCALLFPSLSAAAEKEFEKAFEDAGIPYYAPRANNILNTEEFLVVFGILAKVFKVEANPDGARGEGMKNFQKWLQAALVRADEVVNDDKNLEEFIVEKWTEIEFSKRNFRAMANYCEEKQIPFTNKAYAQTTRVLAAVPKLDDNVKRVLLGKNLNDFLTKKNNEGKPMSVGYVLSRVTSLDWTLLDLFNSYLYTLYRLGETEYEDADDPFPKGCVPFLTVHQSKGLEFPVVVLASCRHNNRQARPLDVLVRKMFIEQNKLPEMAEPLDKMDEYDTMRMFYVALSRAINNFGEVVEHIENSDFAAPDVNTLLNVPDGMKKPFAVHVCRNCDVRYSCKSYAEYMKVSKGANRNNMYKYMCARAEDQDDF
ncbi:MAG: ATP-dependent helicase, partial [Treponema sp.]|nr:ATP-dependent helicase [Treponema sp.]